MAWLRIIIFFLHGCARSCNLSCLDPFLSYLLIPEERKNHLVWAGIEPRSSCVFCSLASALTTRPCLLGQIQHRWCDLASHKQGRERERKKEWERERDDNQIMSYSSSSQFHSNKKSKKTSVCWWRGGWSTQTRSSSSSGSESRDIRRGWRRQPSEWENWKRVGQLKFL